MTFHRPFSIKGLDGVLPPGTYTVETEEELLDQLSFTAYRRVAASIRVPTGGNSYQVFRVDPTDLAVAEEQDRAERIR
ncbi:hypothetical protein ACUN0C_19350 [Faunimonas sp. B44]|uniref:hypothetical protein n=1 Tax=Faunimonas sp. B44 TaxID=3461493 RepID=UPI004043B80C